MLPVDLKNIVYTVISEDIGTYKINNNQICPAIWIGTPPNNTQKSGLEILIPVTASKFFKQGGINEIVWEVYLIQHKTGNQRLHIAAQKLMKFPRCISCIHLPAIRSSTTPDFMMLDQIELKFTDYHANTVNKY